MSRARNLSNRASDFSSAKDSGAVTADNPYSITINGNSTGSSYLACTSGGADSTMLRQYGPSATGTVFGISRTGLGFLQFSGSSSGLIYTSNSSASLRMATNGAVRVVIDPSGNVTFPSNTGAFGYGVGAGGSVTQTTSKTTGVTLNRPTGRITTHNGSLGAGAAVVFVLNNTLISANDCLVLSLGGLNNSYNISVAWVLDGTAGIRVENRTAGSLSDALAINFAVIKGQSS